MYAMFFHENLELINRFERGTINPDAVKFYVNLYLLLLQLIKLFKLKL